ncbi:hypothetical protein HY628_01225 [Candidatus Uhrbacteria bacterium]|nr:hypothetical protein [Candidatus Uhrbacteria bacterium]
MPTLVTWGEVVQSAFENVWLGFVAFLPKFLGAVVVFVVGLLVAVALKNIVVRVCGWLKLDLLAEKLDLKSWLAKVGLTLKIGELLGWLVKWFVIIAALLAAADILEWNQITDFLHEVLLYLPNVIIAVVILLAGILLGNFVRNVVHRAVKAANLESADFLAGVSRWAIFLFSFLAALVQLQVAADLVRMLFAGLVAALALAVGLSFGLGGREQASRFLDKLRREISS